MKKIPAPSKKRLITLASLLTQIQTEKITSVELSSLTGWGEATIRRDISLLELHNGVKNGWEVSVLKNALNTVLKISPEETEKHNCCIVGLEKLGEALLESSVFDNSPFRLTAGFDPNMNRIELMRSKIPLFPTVDLENKIRALKIEYALLAVPDEKAQFMAERLVSYGIKGIVNYTNVILNLDKNIRLRNVNAVLMLKELCAL